MTKCIKNCLNCSFLCNINKDFSTGEKSYVSLNLENRNELKTSHNYSNINCFKKRWLGNNLNYSFLKSFRCKSFYPYNKNNSSISLIGLDEKIKEEKLDRQFWILFILGFISTTISIFEIFRKLF